jgi:Alpha/beta-hydrolase family/Alpha/beta-hydrolase family N-terminus
VRTICWWVSATGLCGAVAGVLQEQAGRENAAGDDPVPVTLAAGMLLGGVNEYRRRRAQAAGAGSPGGDDAGVSALKSLVMSLGVSAGLAAMAAAERVFATGVSRMLARALSGSERLYRPVGHAAALPVAAMAIYEMIRRADHRAEHMDEAIEGAFATPPRSSVVSGGAGSLVSWDWLSREGRRNVSTAPGTRLIERVMGEPAAAAHVRISVGLDSAPTEYQRRDLALGELARTGAFDRELLMVISPTASGYVNYVAVEAAEYLTRGNIASGGHAVLAPPLRCRWTGWPRDACSTGC